MATPSLPWYDDLKRIVAPTEGAANLALALIIVASIIILLRGDAVVKAAWVIYLVSP